MDSELHFEWPGAARRSLPPPAPLEWRPLARRTADRRPAPGGGASSTEPLQQQLDDARATIARLEADRRAARQRIDELEASRNLLETRVTTQRRRLLVLERQLEDANVEPAMEALPSSWFDRLFGGPSSVSAV